MYYRFKKFLLFKRLIPPKRWRPVALVILASFFGLGLYVFKLSNAASYLSDDPKACVNCHLMTPQYITWNRSSHREVAHCNDCHVPHDNLLSKYYFKAKDGLYHSAIFTLRAEPQVIKALGPSIRVIQNNCVRCHQDQVTDARTVALVENNFAHRTDRLCWDCHKEVPHGRVKSLSSVGHQIEYVETHATEAHSVIPAWLKEGMEQQE